MQIGISKLAHKNSKFMESFGQKGLEWDTFECTLVAFVTVPNDNGTYFAQILIVGGDLKDAARRTRSKPFRVCQYIMLHLDEETMSNIEQRMEALIEDNVICQFKGFWPTLQGLHGWIKNW